MCKTNEKTRHFLKQYYFFTARQDVLQKLRKTHDDLIIDLRGQKRNQIGHFRNVRGLGKSMVVFRLFEKLKYSNERSTIF